MCAMRGRIANYIDRRPNDREPRAGFIRKDNSGPDIYFRINDCIPSKRFDVNTQVEFEEKFDPSSRRTYAVRVQVVDQLADSQVSFRPGGRLGPSAGLTQKLSPSKHTTFSSHRDTAQTKMRELEGCLERRDLDNLVSNVSTLKAIFDASDFSIALLQRCLLVLGNEMVVHESQSDALYRAFLHSPAVQTRGRAYILNLQSMSQHANPTRYLCASYRVFYECFSRFPDESTFLPIRELIDGFAVHLQKRKEDKDLIDTSRRLQQFDRWLDLPSLDLVDRSYPSKSKCLPRRNPHGSMEAQDGTDYRTMSILPTMAEVSGKKQEDKESTLEKNKKTFNSIHEYMKINFMLLREDFVHPICEGIRLYREKTFSPKDLHLYYGTKVVGYSSGREGLLFRIRLPPMPHIRWEQTKRLLNGALLCFSDDNFETIIWAIVAQRDEKLLMSSNELDVEVPGGVSRKFLPGKEFVMMENITVYFEAYHHVLEALQNMSEKDFPPMTQSLLSSQKNCSPPSYIDPTNDTFDFTNVFRDSLKSKDSSRAHCVTLAKPNSFPVLKPWPQAVRETVDFDESQIEAMEHAFQHEIALIQGPPGTGKTFIGLKIVQALLDNTEHRGNTAPILVVCYTNHALDQFLEGIYQSTQRIVRIGARSQSEILRDRAMVRLLRSDPNPFREYFGARRVLLDRREELRRKFREQIDILNDATVYWSDVVGFLNSNQRKKFEFGFGNVDTMDEQPWRDHQWMWLTSTHALVLAPLQNQVRNSPRGYDDTLEESCDDEALKEILENSRWEREEEEKNPQTKMDTFALESWLEDSRDIADVSIPNWSAENNLWDMSNEDRRETYRQWALIVQQRAFDCLSSLQKQLDRNAEDMRVLEVDRQLTVLRENRVIGMTTTAVSKYQGMLKALRPSIVVVEEAAEILEAHILTTLHADTSHIILIGDHQQLRPSTAVYRLAKQYNLDVSMFERLIMNGTRYVTLSHQRRMRPVISQLISPLYPQLQNHPVVCKYADVRGVKKNVFFIEHDVSESVDSDTHSKSNAYEVEWITQLCGYFINQGYSPKQITVLSPYLGQVRSLRIAIQRRVAQAKGVRITAVDNFQGEENDIILLSLVRCNAENAMGFLAVANRVCVALSRARIGLFVTGCRKMLEKNTLWSQIFQMLERDGCVGPALEVGCRLHPKEDILITSASELHEKCPHGGCTELCGGSLLCGHPCKLYCHPVGHESIECGEVCGKMLPCEHACIRKCADCSNPNAPLHCGICLRRVTKTLPCGHDVVDLCGKSGIECQKEVLHTFECGHEIFVACCARTAQKCTVLVERAMPCGHMLEMECASDIYSSKVQRRCAQPCGVKMSCNHVCQGECKRCFRTKEHPECERCLHPPPPQIQGHGKNRKKKKPK